MSDIQTDRQGSAPPAVITSDKLAPIAINQRIDAMDILRGIALIGILLMNIEWFNRAIAGLGSQDTSLTGLDHTIGWLIRCFVEGKFYKLFALLFGMGFAVMLIRAKNAERPFGAWFSRRMLALIVFGILHMVFLWSGDILHDYGFAGLLLLGWVMLLKRERFKKHDNPRSFFKLSVIWLSVPIFFSVMAGIGYGMLQDTDELTVQWHEQIKVAERVEEIQRENDKKVAESEAAIELATSLSGQLISTKETLVDMNSSPLPANENQTGSVTVVENSETIKPSAEESIEQQAQAIVAQQQELQADAAEEVTAFTQDSYWTATEFRLNFMFFMLMFTIPFSFTLLLPIFIFGYWLVASGIMKNYRQHVNAFKIAAWLGIGMGLVMETAGLLVAQHPVANQISLLLMVGETLFYIGQLVMTAGYFGLIMSLLADEKWHKRLSVFSPMGRMALTNYISHS